MGSKRFWAEFIFSTVLMIIFRGLEYFEPLIRRKIHKDEVWLYMNPNTESFVGPELCWAINLSIPLCVYAAFFFIQHNMKDTVAASLGTYFSVSFTGIITNCTKLLVGRPRPDFFERCFPDSVYRENMPFSCTGDREKIIEGLKSFPSGHSSMSFASLGFVTLYLAGKLHCFSSRGRGRSWRLVVTILPLLVAEFVAISRTADYHHHWQDVLVGSVLGLAIAYLSYRQRYPSLNKPVSHLPYISLTPTSVHLQAQRQESVISPPTPTSERALLKDV